MTKTRTELHAADLYVLLQREFRRRQNPECSECYVQLPFRVDRHGRDEPNWEVLLPHPCSFACLSQIEELVSEYQMLYDLKVDESRMRLN